MKLGVVFPQTEIGSNPAHIRHYIQTVDALGLDYILAYDHVLGANPDRPGGWNGPYTHETPFHEVFTLFAYMAALSDRLSFITGILILPQRQTALVAKQAAQIDILTGGRFRLGVGVGWNQVEMEGLGEEFSTRGQRSAEQVEVLQKLWTQELVTYRGKYHQLDDVGLNPMPVQRPIPVWFGGGADVVMRRMARLGAGWLPNFMPLDRAEPLVTDLKRYLEEEGRDPASFGMDVRVSAARQKPDEWVRDVRQWRAWGATHVAIDTMRAGYNTVEQHLTAIEHFAARLRDVDL